jgi:hypothetical protein
MKVHHQIEEMDKEETEIAKALSLLDDHLNPLKLKELSVYN